MQKFSQYTQYFLEANITDITGEDLNYDLLKIIKSFLDTFIDHIHIVNKWINISKSLLNHLYIKKTLMEEFPTNATVENIYFVFRS